MISDDTELAPKRFQGRCIHFHMGLSRRNLTGIIKLRLQHGCQETQEEACASGPEASSRGTAKNDQGDEPAFPAIFRRVSEAALALIQIEDRRRFPFAGKTAPSARSDRIQSSMTNVPVTMRTRPHPERRVSLSRKTTRENATVTRMLSLSMGTTTLAGPPCKAR